MVVGPRGEARAVSRRFQALGHPAYPRYRVTSLPSSAYPRYQALLGNVRFRSSASRGTVGARQQIEARRQEAELP